MYFIITKASQSEPFFGRGHLQRGFCYCMNKCCEVFFWLAFLCHSKYASLVFKASFFYDQTKALNLLTNKQNLGLSGKNKRKNAVKKLGCAQAIMNHLQLLIKITPNRSTSLFCRLRIMYARTNKFTNIFRFPKSCSQKHAIKDSQITSRFPRSHVDANAQISRPRMSLGMNSAKYDHTIGTLPPTLSKQSLFLVHCKHILCFMQPFEYPSPLKKRIISRT